MEAQAQGSGQVAGKAGGEFEKGSLSDIESWGLSPSEEIEIKVTQKASQAQAEIFARCNKPGM